MTCSHICNAQYISPLDRFSINEVSKGYAYSVTNKGNATAQTTIASGYVDTLMGASGPYNLAYNNSQWIAFKAWAANLGVNGMCGYEGDWSPDYMSVAGGLS